jgi:predicted nucleic acid-binding protein
LIVVDANVVAFAFIAGEKTELARALKERDPDWRLPRIWREELASVLATQVRAGRLKRDAALGVYDEALTALLVGETEADPLLALELATDLGISAYDAQYLALARQLGVSCVSEDGHLRRADPSRVLTLAEACSGEKR